MAAAISFEAHRTEVLHFRPRILYLCTDPDRVRAQLAGEQLTRTTAGSLRDDISTDEISPLPVMVHFDATLGRYPYVGFKAGDELPIGRDAIRTAGIEVVVAGIRYGKGSSREHSVIAEQSAGVRLVIAESFERIYRQNADSVGLFTSTDFSLIDRIERGDAIPMEALFAGRDALTAAILRHRGLLAYGRARLGSATRRAPSPATQAAPGSEAGAAPPRTLFEKIIARHALLTVDSPAPPTAGQGGFVRADWRFIHEYYTGLCASMLDRAFGSGLALFEPETIVAFEDYLS